MRVSYVFAVSQQLVSWSRDCLHMPAEKVLYLPNFVCDNSGEKIENSLPGQTGTRIVCVANLRPVKDHLTLVRAMVQVKQNFPNAHLLLVGNLEDATQVQAIETEIAQLHLSDNISILGQRHDVNAILSSCDVGVLSSIAEGLPLSLLEYGMAGLPVVATNVGQCADVLAQGEVGLIVPSRDPAALAQGLCRLLESAAERKRLGELFHQRVQNTYSARAVIKQITQVYEQLA